MRNRQSSPTSLLAMAERLATEARRFGGKQIRSKAFKNDIAAFVQRYFSHQPGFDVVQRRDLVRTLDSQMQDLLRCTHKHTVKTKYTTLLKRIIDGLREVEVSSLSRSVGAPSQVGGDARETAIIETLRELSPAAADSFQQGLNDLSSTERVSWRGTVVEFRESLREVLDQLAPDREVTAMPGYKPEKDTHGPTMKQKVMFILKSRQTPESKSKPLADNVAVVDELVGNMVRSVYQRASKATHVACDRKEARRVRDYVLLALSEILAARS